MFKSNIMPKLSGATRVAAILTISIGLLGGCNESQPTDTNATQSVRAPAAGQDLDTFWTDTAWKDLNPTEEKLWRTLGWAEASWNEEAKAPPSETQKWGELTDEGRTAATKLGYDKKYWDSLPSSQGTPEDAAKQ
jgi:hypothetical protein